MGKCVPSVVVTLEEDKCGGKQTSTDCIIFEEAIPYLYLPVNSTLTEVIEAFLMSLVDARNRIVQLETTTQDLESRILTLEEA